MCIKTLLIPPLHKANNVYSTESAWSVPYFMGQVW